MAERAHAALPKGVRADAIPGGICLSGRGLRRRFIGNTALRWLLGALR